MKHTIQKNTAYRARYEQLNLCERYPYIPNSPCPASVHNTNNIANFLTSIRLLYRGEPTIVIEFLCACL